jgi:hypothetical protein
MALETRTSLGSIPRQDLEEERITLVLRIGDMAEDHPERYGLVIRLANVLDEIALRDVGERGPHH